MKDSIKFEVICQNVQITYLKTTAFATALPNRPVVLTVDGENYFLGITEFKVFHEIPRPSLAEQHESGRRRRLWKVDRSIIRISVKERKP